MIKIILAFAVGMFLGLLIGLHPKVHLLHQQITENLGHRYGGK